MVITAAMTIIGHVVDVPADPGGYGAWRIMGDDNQLYLFLATAERTFFRTALPQIGDAVYVEAAPLQGVATVLALTRIEIATELPVRHKSNLIAITLRGSVLERPTAATGVGRWQLFGVDGQRYTVDVYDQRAFTQGLPIIGADVDASGWRMAPKIISADRVAPAAEPPSTAPMTQTAFSLAGQLIGQTAGSGADQLWYLREKSTVYRLRTNASTYFTPTLPALGAYVQIVAVQPTTDQLPLALTVTEADATLGELVVRLQPAVDVATFAAAYQLTPTGVLLASGNIHHLRSANPMLPYLAQFMAQMQHDPAVIWVELNYTGKLPVEGHPHRLWGWGGVDDTSYVNQAAFSQIHLGAVHEIYRGAGRIIAVLDTGVDLAHPSLQGHLLAGWDMVDDDALPDDEGGGVAQGHGTHVSGIIARVAPESQILPVRVLNVDGRGDAFVVAYAIEWAVLQGADVINLSQGMAEESQALAAAVAWAAEQGVAVVAAAGNSNIAAHRYPAAYPAVVAVTAVDEQKQKADFANFGDWVELAAPGVGITSTIVTARGSGYAAWSGTSMAAPFVSGAFALVQEKFPQHSIEELRQRLRSNGEVIDMRNLRYTGLLGTFLNVEESMQDLAPPISFTRYLPMVTVLDSATAVEDPR
jgi:subtilisin family serine protease